MTPSLAVVIPMYNEERGCERCIRTVTTVLAQIPSKPRLIVVEDGGKDGTLAILRRLAQELPELILVEHPVNKGYGAALRTGTERARQEGFEYVLFMDSDLTNNPADIPLFLAKASEGYDVVKASRYSHGGSVSGVPAYRVLISKWGNRVARILFGLPLYDLTNGFRMVRTRCFDRYTLSENNFSIIMEELYYQKAVGCTFAHVPVILTNRDADLRATSFSYRPKIFWDYLKYPLRCRFGSAPQLS